MGDPAPDLRYVLATRGGGEIVWKICTKGLGGRRRTTAYFSPVDGGGSCRLMKNSEPYASAKGKSAGCAAFRSGAAFESGAAF